MAELYTGIRNIVSGTLDGVGGSKHPNGYECTGQQPWDARLTVYKYDDLMSGCSTLYPNKNIYNGMTVTTLIGKSGKPEMWVLKDMDAYMVATTKEACEACWEQVSADSAAISQDIQDAINALDLAQVGGTDKYIEWVKQTDGKVTASAKDVVKYKTRKLTDAQVTALNDANVKEAYEVVSFVGTESTATTYTRVGDVVKVYKDQTLKSVEKRVSGNTQYLDFTYILADGSESKVSLDVSELLAEHEITTSLGLAKTLTNGTIDIKPDWQDVAKNTTESLLFFNKTTNKFVRTDVVDFGTW